MVKVYAVADVVPALSRYIQQGHEYPVKNEHVEAEGFEIYTPVGLTYCSWRGSFHLDGGDWRRVEREE